MISQLAKSVRESLSKAFPHALIKEEEYVSYKGQRLFFDFFIPALGVYVEVQGIQHTEFNRHFHGDAAAYRAAKKRDRLKEEWCELNDLTLVQVNYDEIPIEHTELLRRVEEVQNGR